MNPYTFSCLLVSLASVSFGIFVLRKSRDKRLGKIWLVFNFAVASYGICSIWINNAGSPEMARFALYLDYSLGVIWISPIFYHFVCTFLEQKRPKSIIGNYLVGIAFVFLLPSKQFFSHVQRIFDSLYYGYGGGLYAFFFAWWMGLVLYSYWLLIRAYRDVSPNKKDQIKYFFVATAIGFTGGGLCFLPLFGIYIYPWGNFAVWLYPLIMSYAIVAHRLMEINVVIRKTLLYSCVTAGLASLYAGAVTLLARLLENNARSPVLYPTEIFRWIGGNLQILFAYSCVATSFFSVGLGLFVWFKGRQRPINRMWALTCLSIAAWSLGKGMIARAGSFSEAFAWQEWCTYLGACTIPILFLHFTFLVLNKRPSWVLKMGYAWAVLLFFLNVTGRLVSIQAQFPFHYYTLPLKPFWFYLTYFFGLVIYAHALMVRALFTEEARLRNQIKFILLGTSIGFLGGSTSFFLTLNIPIFPYGIYAVPLYIVTVSYAIFKHQLMEINVVIRKTLLYSLVSAALASVYVGTITLLAHVLGGRQGSASTISSVFAAVFITLLFNPLRVRLQRWIDRQFPRERLDPALLQEAAGGFAHEMKRPLTKISLPAQLALEDLGRLRTGELSWEEGLDKMEERLKFIVHQSIDAGAMIEAIRELSMVSTAPTRALDLGQLLRDTLHEEKELFARYGVSAKLRLSPGPFVISGHVEQLKIVFINLVKNAAESMGELPSGQARELHIGLSSNESHVLVDFADTGPGIKAEEIGKIFQARYTTKGPRGTGIGLYLSHNIVQAHRGTIQVESVAGEGCVFRIKFPLESHQ